MVMSFSENVARLDQCIYSYSQACTADADPATAVAELVVSLDICVNICRYLALRVMFK